MSRIFLNHTYRLFTLRQFPNVSDPNSLENQPSFVSSFCSTDSGTNKHLRKIKQKLANSIILNKIYTIPTIESSGSLIPSNSRLFSGGQSTNETPDFSDIIENLDLRVKINHLIYNGHKFRVGHLRFRFLDYIPVQVFIFVEFSPGFTVILTKSLPKMQDVVFDYIAETLNSVIGPLSLPDDFLRSTVDESVQKAVSEEDIGSGINWHNDLGDIELSFTGIKTKCSALNAIVLNIKFADVPKFIDEEGFVAGFCSYMQSETSIDFKKLELTRARNEWFLLTSDGRLRFSDRMSYHTQPSRHDDTRPTIWNIMFSLYTNAGKGTQLQENAETTT